MNEEQLKYTLQRIKKANNLSTKVFYYLYELDEKKFCKTIYRITEINEILTQLEISLEILLGIDDESLSGDEDK